MQKHFSLILSLFIILSAFSCREKCDNDTLVLSVKEFNFAAEGDVGDIQIITNTDWYINSTTEWLSFVPTSGEGNSTITVKAIYNTEDTDRSASFFIHAGKLTDTVSVKQKGTYLTLSKKDFLFDREGTPTQIELLTNYSWEIGVTPDWCVIDPLNGEGDAILVLTPKPYEKREPRYNDAIEIVCNGSSFFILVSQEIENVAPTSSVLLSPENESLESGLYPYFSWEESSDEDGDIVKYKILLSKDREAENGQWIDLSGWLDNTEYLVTRKVLEENTLYYWKVLAADDFQGETCSDIYSFTTGTNIIYDNDQVLTLQTTSLTNKISVPNLVILGDGFVSQDFGKGNIYDIMTDIAIESFFLLEPLKSYRDYFNVYQIVTYSEESGATVSRDFINEDVPAQTKNTVFNSSFQGGDSPTIRCNTDTIFTYVQENLNLSNEQLDNTTILLIINLDVYAGTTAISPTGRSISMCPTGRNTFSQVVYHEGAGHGFGRLVDEYIYFPALSLEERYRNTLLTYRGDDVWNFGANVSLTNHPEEVHWKHYLNRKDYEVDFYEGAYHFGKDIWRPEQYSCMDDNIIPYFNAPSREAIVRRLMKIIGREFDWDKFYKTDQPKTYIPEVRSFSIEGTSKRLASPVLLDQIK